VVDGQFVVKHRHLHDLALQRAYVEMEIHHRLVLKIGYGEKSLREFLVQPSSCRKLSHCGEEALKNAVELDFGF